MENYAILGFITTNPNYKVGEVIKINGEKRTIEKITKSQENVED